MYGSPYASKTTVFFLASARIVLPSSTSHLGAILNLFLTSFFILAWSLFGIGLVKFSKKTRPAFFKIFNVLGLMPSTPDMPRPINHNMVHVLLAVYFDVRFMALSFCDHRAVF